ncbi:unnamed protein product [Effrenium voratum]|nr:unnamed protein product [Effrenium voratum]
MDECVRRGPSRSTEFEQFSKVTLTPNDSALEGSQVYAGKSIPCWLSSRVKAGSLALPFGTLYRLLLCHVPHLDYKTVKQVSMLRQAGTDWRGRQKQLKPV